MAILLASCPKAEICVFQAYRPPSWIFQHPVSSDSILTMLIVLLDPNNMGVAIGILLISCLEAEIHLF